MGDYEGLTNQDVDPVDVWEEMQAQTAEDDDPDDCGGEFVDGTWEGCGICQVCLSTSDDAPDEED